MCVLLESILMMDFGSVYRSTLYELPVNPSDQEFICRNPYLQQKKTHVGMGQSNLLLTPVEIPFLVSPSHISWKDLNVSPSELRLQFCLSNGRIREDLPKLT